MSLKILTNYKILTMKTLNKKVLVVTLLVLMFLPVMLLSGDRRDGNWWNNNSYEQKLNYIIGLYDGINLGYNLSYWEFMLEDNECLEKVRQSYSYYFFEYLNNVTNGQVVDGLDILYEDYRNRKIMVENAVWLVLNEINGKPREEMDEMIRNYRKNAE